MCTASENIVDMYAGLFKVYDNATFAYQSISGSQSTSLRGHEDLADEYLS